MGLSRKASAGSVHVAISVVLALIRQTDLAVAEEALLAVALRAPVVCVGRANGVLEIAAAIVRGADAELTGVADADVAGLAATDPHPVAVDLARGVVTAGVPVAGLEEGIAVGLAAIRVRIATAVRGRRRASVRIL
jgi:hypothetical protein